ncbi:hypothetical protein C2G38_2326777 [Gigaspora rosea]|uniref:CCHC-type domain-containing protein n=1 Tax=Gigaspora rosea TaxID=44941 RepID=A0A397UZV3_9GLOM|nr:hypothetical protein C2G38_2326777 [Gigaspora rosea]
MASYLQQPVNGITHPPAPELVEDPIKKLTTLIPRGNSSRNRGNMPFHRNQSQVICFTCQQPGHMAYECPTFGNNTNNNPRPVNENEKTRVTEGEENPNRNRPTVDVNRAQAILA